MLGDMDMTYSVFDPAKGLYDYYVCKEKYRPFGNVPSPRGRGDLGSTPEQAAPRLPLGCKHMGQGERAKGTICYIPGRSPGLSGVDLGSDTLLGIALVAIGGYMVTR